MSNKKIVWIAHEGSLSGANLCLLEYMKILKENHFEIHLIVPRRGKMSYAAESEGISTSEVYFYTWASPIGHRPGLMEQIRHTVRNFIAVKQIKKILIKEKPDFVATNTITVSVGAIAAKKCKIRHYWFVHEFGEEDHGFTIAGDSARGAKIMDRLSAKMVFNSLATQNKFSKYTDISKSCIVYNTAGVFPESHITEIPGSVFKLIILGQISPSKNHIEALRALSVCKMNGLQFELNIVGHCESELYKNHLQNFILAEGLQDNVHILEAVSNPAAILQKHHALLMCSRMEAFGRVTVEALKCGLPVIAANSGGSTEIIEDGVNGYFYNSGNCEELAGKISELIEHYHLFDRNEISNNAIKKFNPEKTLNQLLKVFSI